MGGVEHFVKVHRQMFYKRFNRGMKKQRQEIASLFLMLLTRILWKKWPSMTGGKNDLENTSGICRIIGAVSCFCG